MPLISRSRGAGLAGTSSLYGDKEDTLGGEQATGATTGRTVGKADFRFLKDACAMNEVQQHIDRLFRVPPPLRRKTKAVRRPADGLDIAASVRSALSSGGYIFNPVYRARLRERPEVVILHDVSHSMSWNNPLLFRMVRSLLRALPKSETFAFHVQMFRTTALLRERSNKRLLQRLESRNSMWMGGTCIARSIRQFRQNHGRKVLRKNRYFVVISDGFDSDELDALASEIKIINRSCKGTIWLNPMLGRKGCVTPPEFEKKIVPLLRAHLPGNQLDGLTGLADLVLHA